MSGNGQESTTTRDPALLLLVKPPAYTRRWTTSTMPASSRARPSSAFSVLICAYRKDCTGWPTLYADSKRLAQGCSTAVSAPSFTQSVYYPTL